MPLVVQACPSFESEWHEFLAYWQEESEPPLYAALEGLSRHLIGMLARQDVSSFPAVFAVIERWHLEGDAYVKEAATVGLLEDLQNRAAHDTTTPEQFRAYLGPESAKWWDKVSGFWERGEMLPDD